MPGEVEYRPLSQILHDRKHAEKEIERLKQRLANLNKELAELAEAARKEIRDVEVQSS